LLLQKRGKLLATLFVYLQLGFLLTLFIAPSPAQAEETDKFSSNYFENTWQRTDQPVLSKRSQRSWYWGPEPLSTGVYETYISAPYGRRLVQYFDKARMEINNPTSPQVTNGLLVVELITGSIQQGDAIFNEQNGAKIAIAGDTNNPSPTYHQLKTAYELSAKYKLKQPIVGRWEVERPSLIPQLRYIGDKGTYVASIQNDKHIPQVFWDFMNERGLIYNNGRYVDGTLSDWKFSLGLPITEPYWSRVKVSGIEKDVLFQAFERRVLTYTPSNSPDFQVEMGNVGAHYLEWRYADKVPQYDEPILSLFDASNQPKWYKTTEVLNVRTAPTAESTRIPRTDSKPFVSQMQKGDHIQVIRTVTGQEVVPGNNRWFQIYEKPDLFIYSEYTEPLQMPEFPKPNRTNKGLWVAVSLDKQMMAVYQDNKPLLVTLVATGRTNYATPTGSFRVMGGWRPLAQIMEGGNLASDDHYRLEDVRFPSYIVGNVAIHGSYWHSKYGIAPQSRGCINASVHDASLIHQLPVGTPVEVFY
jgi:L,D-transpeptidase catalytic domain